MSKKPKTYNLSKEVRDAVSERALSDGRKDSDWLNRYLTKKLLSNKPKNKTELAEVKPTSKRFTPPTVEEVFQYCNERCNNVDAQAFVDHYTGNGWMRGKTKIKDWKACVRTWEKNSKDKAGAKQFSKTTEQNINNIGEWLNE